MPRMVSLKRPKGDADKEKLSVPDAYRNADDDGPSMNLEHHHLMKMKDGDGEPIAGRLKSGHQVEFHGSGVVERSETKSGKDGDQHSATIRMHKGSLEHEPDADEERAGLRNEISRNTEASGAEGA